MYIAKHRVQPVILHIQIVLVVKINYSYILEPVYKLALSYTINKMELIYANSVKFLALSVIHLQVVSHVMIILSINIRMDAILNALKMHLY